MQIPFRVGVGSRQEGLGGDGVEWEGGRGGVEGVKKIGRGWEALEDVNEMRTMERQELCREGFYRVLEKEQAGERWIKGAEIWKRKGIGRRGEEWKAERPGGKGDEGGSSEEGPRGENK